MLVVEPMLRTMKVNTNVLSEGTKKGFTNATDLADYLAKKSVPFREAHEIVGGLVLHCVKRNCSLEDLTLDEYKRYSPVFENDLFEAISIEYCVNQRKVQGGPSPEAVGKAIEESELQLSLIKW